MRKGISYRGKHSYKDFGLILKSRRISIPQKRKTKESVPFQNGSYDFSGIYGSQAYDEREGEYTFYVTGSTIQEMEHRKIAAINWLNNSQKEPLRDDQILGFYFMAEFETAEFNPQAPISELTTRFNANPFMIAESNEGSDIWDTFNFLLDYVQETKFTISGSKTITLHNQSSTQVIPTIKTSSSMEITKNGVTYSVQTGETKDWKLSLDKGENTILINGSGTIEFIFRKEVL